MKRIKLLFDDMLSTSQLNVSSFTEITFASTSCELDAETLIITGDMTLRGTTRTLSFDVDFDASNDGILLLGSINFNHSDFNIEPYSALVDSLNSQPLTISFDLCLASPGSSTIWGVSVFDRC